MMYPRSRRLSLVFIALLGLFGPVAGFAETPSCYDRIEHPPADLSPHTSLYVFIDQTTPLTRSMQQDILRLVEARTEPGTRIRIARLSANARGQYAELVHDDYIDLAPSDYLVFNLRRKDRHVLKDCLEARGAEVRGRLMTTLDKTLALADDDLPKTELLHSLKRLSRNLVADDPAGHKVLLLVTDGLENSPLVTFHAGKSIKALDSARLMKTVREQNLVADWRGTDIYLYGVGHIPDRDVYVPARLLAGLREFWESYFGAGGGTVVEIGTPALLQASFSKSAESP